MTAVAATREGFDAEYKFVRSFVLAGQEARKDLETKGTLATIAPYIFSAVPRSAQSPVEYVLKPLSSLVNLGIQFKDKKDQQKSINKVQAILNAQSGKDGHVLTNQLVFIRIFIEAALEIFSSFENQLEFVSLETDHMMDNRRASELIAQLAAKLCFHKMIEQKSAVNLTSVIGQLRTSGHEWENFKGSTKAWFDKLRVYKLLISWNGRRFKMSTFEFLKQPIPAWSIFKSEESLNSAPSPTHLFINKLDKEAFSKTFETQGIFLRRPMKFEWDKHETEKGLEKIPVKTIPYWEMIKVQSFLWCNKVGKSEDIYKRLICDKDFDSNLALWNHLIEMESRIICAGRQAKEETVSEVRKIVESTMESLMPKWASIRDQKPIFFQVPHQIISFYGRKDFLKILDVKLQENRRNDSAMISTLIKIVSGLGGIGKTQTAIQYICEFGKCFDNVIWIEAESTVSLKTSFWKLASELQIPLENQKGETKDISDIVKNIFNLILSPQKYTLIIFDNAEDCESGIENVLPASQQPELKNLSILVTSRNRRWNFMRERLEVIPLDVFTEEESLDFILKQLEVSSSPEVEEETREFIELMGGLPLALQQSVAFIEQQRRDFWIPYGFSHYIKDFKTKREKLQNFLEIPGQPSRDPQTVAITWNVTLDKIKKLNYGQSAIEIINCLAFLYADKIPAQFLNSVLPHISDFYPAVNLLENYSLVKANRAEKLLSIHRQLQSVILQGLKNDGIIETVFFELVDNCTRVLCQIGCDESDEIFLNVNHLLQNPYNLIPASERLLDLVQSCGLIFSQADRHLDSLSLIKKFFPDKQRLLGENHEKTLQAQFLMARQLHLLGKLDEALTEYQTVLDTTKNYPDLENQLTLTTKHYAIDLQLDQGKDDESLTLLEQVYEQERNIYRDDPGHLNILKTQNQLARVYYDLGHFKKALEMYQEVEKWYLKNREPDDEETLSVQRCVGSVLCHIGKLTEASEVLHAIYWKQKQSFGETIQKRSTPWCASLSSCRCKIDLWISANLTYILNKIFLQFIKTTLKIVWEQKTRGR